MTVSQGPEPPPDPATDVVEFGGAGRDSGRDPADPRAGWLRRSTGMREPRIGWVLGGLGGLALFGSLVGEWSITTYRFSEESFEGPAVEEMIAAGAATAGNWGAAWMIGALALVTTLGVCLGGPAHLRAAARTVGLAVAAALLLVMAAAGVDISADGLAFDRVNVTSMEQQTEVSLERGLFAAYVALGLFAAALWLAPVPSAAGEVMAGPPPEQPVPAPRPAPAGQAGDPGDLTVGPAEPFIHPTGNHEWR